MLFQNMERVAGCPASKEGKMYSFGILVLEMFTGKRPTGEMFKEGLSLHGFVKAALADRVMEIVDPFQYLIGVICSAQSPTERMNIENVTRELCLIKKSFPGLGPNNHQVIERDNKVPTLRQ